MQAKSNTSAKCHKFGEYPAFGSPTPTRLLKMLNKDRHIYLQGRQCENQGLGIGAFAYYRRVVENQKNAIIDEIVRVSTKLKLSDDLVKVLSEAKNEKQFSKSVEAIKDGIPQVLFIDGHNPLTLLHRALSEGLHAETDAACLEAAHVIRIVLADYPYSTPRHGPENKRRMRRTIFPPTDIINSGRSIEKRDNFRYNILDVGGARWRIIGLGRFM
jgi:hypothetical protein